MTTPATSDEIAELVRRLRVWAARDGIILSGPTCQEAADAIEQQAREIAAGKAALDGASQYYRKLENELSRRATELADVRRDLEITQNNANAVIDELNARLVSARRETEEMREILNRYRYAVCWAAADSWDCAEETRIRFEWARSNDPGGHLTGNQAAEIAQQCGVALSAQPDPHKEGKPERKSMTETLMNPDEKKFWDAADKQDTGSGK